MADDRTLRVRIQAEIGNYVAGLKQAGVATQEFGRNLSGMGSASKADMEKIGRGALIMAGGIGLALGGAAKAAIDWESAWAGVTKTVDGTTSQMADLEDGLRDLAKELPATHGEIAAVAEAAGALGIQRGAIEGFTKTMIDLGETTNVTADQAATSLAQIANVMGTSQGDFDRMGSALVDLGNKGASTESEILELASRLAAAGEIAGLTEAEVFGFASTLASVGVEAEAGGTAVSKVFTRIRDAVIDGGDKLETFAGVAGVTASEFAAAFQESPTAAIEMFVTGLDRMNSAGESTSATFKDLDLNDERLKRALLSMAGAGELLHNQLEIGRQAWEDNNALQTEAEKRYATTAAQMEMLRNQVVDFAIDVGDILIPAIRSAVDFIGTLVKGFSAMPDAMKFGIAGIGLFGFGLAGLIGVVGTLIPKIIALRAALLTMGAAGQFANAALPWLAAAAAAIGVMAFVFGQNAKAAQQAEERIDGYAEAIRNAGDVTEGTKDQIRTLITDTPELVDVLEAAGVSADAMGAALAGSESEWSDMRAQLLGAADDAGITGLQLEALTGGLDAQRIAAQSGADQAATLSGVLGDTGDEARNAAPALDTLAGSLGLNAEQAKAAADEFKELMDAYRGAIDPLFGLLDALQANRDAMGAEAKARAEGLTAIADAQEDVAEAERNLAEARASTGEGAAGRVADAEGRLADARQRQAEAQAEAAVTAEELAGFNQAVAESALDVDVAMKQLEASIAQQPELVQTAIGMLQQWVDQGYLTQQAADDMAAKFQVVADKAHELQGDFVANVYANTDGALSDINILKTALLAIQNLSITIGAAINPFGPKPGQNASGTANWRGGPTWVGERGPELVSLPGGSRIYDNQTSMAMVSPGQMFHNGSEQSRYGTLTAAGAGSSVTHQVDRSLNIGGVQVTSKSDEAIAKDVIFEARVLAAGMAS